METAGLRAAMPPGGPAAGGETVKKHSLTAKKEHGSKISPRSFFCVKISPLFRIE